MACNIERGSLWWLCCASHGLSEGKAGQGWARCKELQASICSEAHVCMALPGDAVVAVTGAGARVGAMDAAVAVDSMILAYFWPFSLCSAP